MGRHPYATAAYGRSFRSAHPVDVVTASGVAWLRRPIPGSARHDHAGPYPMVAPADYAALTEDFDALRRTGSVSVVFVTDPFDEDRVLRHLGTLALCRPFKTHYIVDLATPWRDTLSGHHRRGLRKAGADPPKIALFRPARSYGPAFWRLYRNLIDRHAITGMQALGPEILAEFCGLEGTVVVEARNAEDRLIAASIWVHDGEKAHLHLHAQTPEGYDRRAGLLLYEAALDHFTGRVARVALGGGAGLADDAADGLARFKRGFANATARSCLCGEILDKDAYRELSGAAAPASGFFPAYRG